MVIDYQLKQSGNMLQKVVYKARDIFSGSNDVNTVAWFENNATQTQKIGTKSQMN